MTSKSTFTALTNRAFVRAVAGFAAFFAHRSLTSTAVASVLALRFERAFAIAALVFKTRSLGREAHSDFVSLAVAQAPWRWTVDALMNEFRSGKAVGCFVCLGATPWVLQYSQLASRQSGSITLLPHLLYLV